MKKFFWVIFLLHPFLLYSQSSLNQFYSKTEQNDASEMADIEFAVFNKTDKKHDF